VNQKADFLQNESIRIDSHNESNRIYSNRELECSTSEHVYFKGVFAAHELNRLSTNRPSFAAAVQVVTLTRVTNERLV